MRSITPYIEYLMLISLVAVFGTAAYQRNFIWKDDLSLWSDGVKKSPGKAHDYMGIACGSKGLHNEAFQEIRMSKALSSKGKWDLIRREMKTTPSQHAPH